MSITYTVKVDEDTIKWYLNGQLHREDGPATELAIGTKIWYLNGQHHREDGPAIEYDDGDKYWYLKGVEMTEDEHARRTQPVLELTMAEVEKLIGRPVKIIK